MCVDFLPEIRHTAVADFNCRPIKDLVEDVVCWNSSSRILKNDRPTLVARFLLNGGLYQMTLLRRFFLEDDGKSTFASSSFQTCLLSSVLSFFL